MPKTILYDLSMSDRRQEYLLIKATAIVGPVATQKTNKRGEESGEEGKAKAGEPKECQGCHGRERTKEKTGNGRRG